MKSEYVATRSFRLVLLALLPVAALGGCSQSGVTTPATDAAAPGTGGTSSSGGSPGSGGTTGTGGAALGTGGADATGGVTGSGGDTGLGGSTALGGRSGSTGGVVGTGGGVGAGGTQGGGGRGGSSTGPGGSGVVTIDSIAGIPNNFGDSLKSSWYLFPCYGQQGQDCTTVPQGAACPNMDNMALPFEQRGVSFSETFKLGGTPGTMYNLTIRVNGITEGKYYMGGTRSAGTAAPPNADATAGIDTFYTGGSPVDFENYNVYKIVVYNTATPPVEIQHYYLNSMPPNTGTSFENHNTFPLGYNATFPVMGGGTIMYLETDRNCRAIDNCGAGRAGVSTSCQPQQGRMIPNEAATVIPTMWQGKSVASLNLQTQASQPFHSQIIHVTVTAVAPM